jgi:acetylornithine deacetylase
VADASPRPARYTTVEMLDRLVAFDTTSRNSNLELIAFIRAYLEGLGLAPHLSFNESRDKANIVCSIGPVDRAGVVLSGHVDTVPVDGQAWTSDPFRLTRRDGRLFGRGTTDMKGFVATFLAMAPEFMAAPLAKPIHFCISFDEEIGLKGVPHAIADIAARLPLPEACIVGEPSGMKPVLAHKGKLALTADVRGVPGHSSDTERGANALEAAAEAVAYLKAEARRFRDHGPYDARFDPAFTSVHTGVFRSGTVLNMIPEHATFTMEWRFLPGTDIDAEYARLRRHCETAIEPELKHVDARCGFTWSEYSRMPGMGLAPDHALATLVKQLAGSNDAGAVSYGTEGGLFEAAGIPTLVCGPGHIQQAHQPDEFIAESELAACEKFLRALKDRLSG